LDRTFFVGAAKFTGSIFQSFNSQGGNMGLLLTSLAFVLLAAVVAFAAGYVMVVREQMAVDERLYRCTH
jgi:hypothetical protein